MCTCIDGDGVPLATNTANSGIAYLRAVKIEVAVAGDHVAVGFVAHDGRVERRRARRWHERTALITFVCDRFIALHSITETRVVPRRSNHLSIIYPGWLIVLMSRLIGVQNSRMDAQASGLNCAVG